MKQARSLTVSILLSLISIGISVFINIQIAKAYINTDGKGRALFGIILWLQFGYRYYVAILGLVALIIALFNIKGDAQLRAKLLLAILLSIFALTIVFIQFWKLFVPSAIPPYRFSVTFRQNKPPGVGNQGDSMTMVLSVLLPEP